MDLITDQDYDDPERQTCKVVKIINPNRNTGARIYPKNCKVRNVVYQDQANEVMDIQRFTKRGKPKRKIKTIDRAYYMQVGPISPIAMVVPVNVLYDTGATNGLLAGNIRIVLKTCHICHQDFSRVFYSLGWVVYVKLHFLKINLDVYYFLKKYCTARWRIEF
eukprot:SAG31_NODE_15318_length_760_cov_16.205749_2_plen_163_part_00